jgi:hypothetical protein
MYRIVAAGVVSNQLVASPWPLDHLDSLAVCETAVTCGAGVGRCDQGLICLAVGTVEQVLEISAGLTHGDPRMAAGGGVVERAAAHLASWDDGLKLRWEKVRW